MNKKLTTSGVVFVALGALVFIVGMGMFLSLMFGMINHDPFSGSGITPIPMGQGVVGVLMAGLGGLLVKVGLGLTIAGQAENAVNWYKKTSNNVRDSKECPLCGSANNTKANYCNSCGSPV